MIRYVDTSVMVSALTAEAQTSPMQAWLELHVLDGLATSLWTVAEFSAALSIKIRTGAITPVERDAIMPAFDALIADSFVMLDIVPRHFRVAAELATRHRAGLRAGDALHLAIAS